MSSTLNSDNLNGTLSTSGTLEGTISTSDTLSGELSYGTISGTSDYNDLSNKPQINGVTLSGNKTTSDLNLFSGDFNDLSHVNLDGDYDDTVVFAKYSYNIEKWQLENGAKLKQLSDVEIGNPATLNNNDFIGVDLTSPLSPKWKNRTLAAVATSGDYDDLTNKPTIPAAQVNSDWNSSSGVSEILNKPNLAAVATSGNYSDLSNKPLFSVITRSQNLTLSANSSGYIQLANVLDFPTSRSVLIGFFAYAALTYATRGTIIAAGLIENGAKPYIHYQTGEAGFSDVPFYFRFVFYTEPL